MKMFMEPVISICVRMYSYIYIVIKFLINKTIAYNIKVFFVLPYKLKIFS